VTEFQDERVRRLYAEADPMDVARSEKTLADLIAEDREDSTTPDHFDVGLKPIEQVEEELSDPDVVGALEAQLRVNIGEKWEGDGPRPLGIGGSAGNIQKCLDAAKLLRDWGWTVVFMDGWSTRGANRRQLAVSYIGDHHTAAEVDVDRILRDGRSDVPGPLCNGAVHKDSVIVFVAAGPANHFGVASINSSDAFGVENTGPIPITARGKGAFPNYRATLALYVALRTVYGLSAGRIVLHKETAEPPGRKIDRAVDGNDVRSDANTNQVLADPNQQEEDDFDMRTDAEIVELARQGAAKALNALTPVGEQSIVTAFERLYRETRAQADDQAVIANAVSAAQGAVLGALQSLDVELSDEAIQKIADSTGLTPDIIRAEVRKVFLDAGTDDIES
jgi:hypothetical protein